MVIFYVCAIALQVCGALILLISSLIGTERKMFRAISKNGSGAPMSGVWIDDINISDELRNIYLNRVAFVCLILGYLLGVLGEVGNFPKYKIIILIVIATATLVGVLYGVCHKVAEKRQEIYKNRFKDLNKKRII